MEHEAVRSKRPAASARVVYVDESRLLALHPGWDAINEMSLVLSTADSAWKDSSAFAEASVSGTDEPVENDVKTTISRKSLEKETMRSASESLREWETQRGEALHARTNSMRDQLTAASDASLIAKRKDLEDSAAEMAQAAEESRVPELLRGGGGGGGGARIKLSALRVASKLTGVDTKKLIEEKAETQASIDAMDKTANADVARINAVVQGKIAVLQDLAVAEIDAKVSEYEKSEDARIRQSVLEARDGVLQELSAAGADSQKIENLQKIAGSGSSRISAVRMPSSAAARGSVRNSEMLARMRLDVKRAVMALAAKRGMEVVFVQKRGVPDATADFEKMLKNNSWPGISPVLSAVRG